MAKVKIMRGISGAGKSTYIKNHFPAGLVFSADHFWIDENGKYNFDLRRLGEAHAWCLRKFILECKENTDPNAVIVVDNTNTSIAELAPYVAVANAYGHDVEVISINIDVAVANKRNVHNVPMEATERQHRNFKRDSHLIPKHWNNKLVPAEGL